VMPAAEVISELGEALERGQPGSGSPQDAPARPDDGRGRNTPGAGLTVQPARSLGRAAESRSARTTRAVRTVRRRCS
jgi:hypothetical protein